MDPRTLNFLCFAVFSGLSLALGYVCRRRGWVAEERSKPIHLFTMAWVWSAVALVGLWRGPVPASGLWLVVMQVLIVAVAGYGAVPLARRLGFDGRQTGVLAPACGLGNLGFTLGSYICYSLLQPADAALGLATAYVSVMQVASVVLMFPLARYYGEFAGGSVAQLVLRSFVDLRSLSLYAAIAGQVLGQARVPPPQWFDRLHLMDVLFYLGSFGGYFGIGLRLRLGDSLRFVPQQAMLSAVKFLFIPLLTLGLLALTGLTPWPVAGIGRDVALIQGLMPTAIQCVMIANLFGLDPRFASSLWLWNTILFLVLPLPLILWFWG